MRPILLVEDSQDDVFFLRRALDQVGIVYPLHVACHGREAIDYLTELVGTGQPLPIFVLLDLQMPGMRGFDVLKWIREQKLLRKLIVIIHTSSHLDIDIERAYELGANSFLTKTTTAENLVRMMELIEAYWLRLNVPPVGEPGPAS